MVKNNSFSNVAFDPDFVGGAMPHFCWFLVLKQLLLKNHKRALAEEYIRRTPTQIETHYRSLIEKELDWKPIL